MMDLEKQKQIAEKRLEEIESKLEAKKKPVKKCKTKFYHFNQNNSGGSFDEDENVCKHVFIEATSAEHANLLADNFGIYFDGCNQGTDCSCCGDRWYEVSESDGKSKPLIWSHSKMVSPSKAFKDTFSDKCIIHYLNGRKKVVVFKDQSECKHHDYKQQYDIGKKCTICGKWEHIK